MEKISVKKDVLLEKIKENQELHKELYDEAMEAFRKNYKLTLEKMIEDGTKEKFVFSVPLQKPENHYNDYTDTIKMIDMDCRDIIVLDETEFRQYILNQWGWIRSFRMTYISNMSGISGISGSSGTSGASGMSKKAMDYFGDTFE